MISGTSTNYVGRQKDVLIMRGLDPALPNPQTVDLSFGRPSSFCAGIQKLVQRYMIALLTELGSQDNFPTFGTPFIRQLHNSNSSQSRNDVEHLFNFANLQVLSSFRAYQALHRTDPLDEQIGTATLLNFVNSGDTASFNVQITSLAGTTVTFLIPLPEQ